MRLVYPAASALADIIDTIGDFITNATYGRGWALYDNAAGTNAKAYRALNADGTTYKYIVLDYNTAGYILFKVYTSWNSGTHSGTNVAYLSDQTGYAQRIDITNGGSLYMSVRAAAFVMQSSNGSSTGAGACGVVEISRDNAEDTGGTPYVWINTSLMLDATPGGTIGIVAYPASPQGNTGSAASAATFMITDFGAAGCDGNQQFNAMNQSGTGIFFPPGKLRTLTNSWSGKYWISDIKIYSMSGYFNITSISRNGRMLFAKLITVGTLMDECSCKISAAGLLDPAGSPTTYIIFSSSTGPIRLCLPK
jgi:hypothetical protein